MQTLRSDPILAAAFAQADAKDQALMLNTMGRELFVACDGQFKFEQQLCALSADLNRDGIAFIKQLHAFAELRKQEMQL